MKFTQRILIALVVAASVGCASLTIKKAIDKSDRVAFESLHGFQQVEEAAWHANAPWPTADQHQKIGAALSKAFLLVSAVAQAGIDLKDGQPLPSIVVQEMTDLTSAVAQIVALSQTAPPPAVAASVDAQTNTASLVIAVQAKGR